MLKKILLTTSLALSAFNCAFALEPKTIDFAADLWWHSSNLYSQINTCRTRYHAITESNPLLVPHLIKTTDNLQQQVTYTQAQRILKYAHNTLQNQTKPYQVFGEYAGIAWSGTACGQSLIGLYKTFTSNYSTSEKKVSNFLRFIYAITSTTAASYLVVSHYIETPAALLLEKITQRIHHKPTRISFALLSKITEWTESTCWIKEYAKRYCVYTMIKHGGKLFLTPIK